MEGELQRSVHFVDNALYKDASFREYIVEGTMNSGRIFDFASSYESYPVLQKISSVSHPALSTRKINLTLGMLIPLPPNHPLLKTPPPP